MATMDLPEDPPEISEAAAALGRRARGVPKQLTEEQRAAKAKAMEAVNARRAQVTSGQRQAGRARKTEVTSGQRVTTRRPATRRRFRSATVFNPSGESWANVH